MSSNKIVEANECVKKAKAREVMFFELATLAAKGREAMFEAVKKVMKSKDMDVTPALFGKCGLASRPAGTINALIQDSGRNLTTGDQLAAQAEDAVEKFLSEEAALNPALPAIIETAQGMGIEVVAISPWGEDVSEALMKKLGLDEMGVELICQDCPDENFPRADHWLRFLKQRAQESIPVIALVTSSAACRGALTAGATCVVVPDKYTSFEDFSGAKLVLDSLDEMDPKELLAMVSRH